VNLTWKVYGPDLNGSYGGLQGTGGLEATILDSNGTATGVLNDYFGNAVATVSGGSVTWNTTKVGGYGPLPDSSATPLTNATQLAQAIVWRGHRIDPTGFYYLGARYYEPTSGRFLSPDPKGQAASMSLYDFCNGDPVNSFDPDGRGACQLDLPTTVSYTDTSGPGAGATLPDNSPDTFQQIANNLWNDPANSMGPATTALVGTLQQLPMDQRVNLLSTADSAWDSAGNRTAELTQPIFGGNNGTPVSVGSVITGTPIPVGEATAYDSGTAIATRFQSSNTQQTVQQSGLDYVFMSHSDSVNSSDLPSNVAQITQSAPVPTVLYNPGNVTVITTGVQPVQDPSRSSYGGATPILSSSPGIEVTPTQTFKNNVLWGGGK
jgi:RHS repeat-associated protein